MLRVRYDGNKYHPRAEMEIQFFYQVLHPSFYVSVLVILVFVFRGNRFPRKLKQNFTLDTTCCWLTKIFQYHNASFQLAFINWNSTWSLYWNWIQSLINWLQYPFIYYSGFPSSNGQIFRLLLKISVEENTQRA